MTESFQVQPERVRGLAQVFADARSAPTELAAGLRGADAASTGRPSLDAQLHQVVGQFGQALTTLAELVAEDAAALTEIADDYLLTDDEVALTMQDIDRGGPVPVPEVAPDPAPEAGPEPAVVGAVPATS